MVKFTIIADAVFKVLGLNIRGEQTVADVEEEEKLELSIIEKMADTLSLSTTEVNIIGLHVCYRKE